MMNIHVQFPYFHELSPEEAVALTRCLAKLSVHNGQYLFHRGDPADALYFLFSGMMKITYGNLRGDEVPIGFFQSGDVFGHLFFGKYRFRVGSAIALTNCLVGRLCESDFIQLVESYPKMGVLFMRLFADYQRESLARLHALMHVDVRARLLGALLNFARHLCCPQDDWFQLPNTLTQADIATIAGVNRTTASLLINEFRRAGILGGQGRILMVNIKAVRNFLEEQGVEILE